VTLVVVVAAPLASGCSFIFSEGAPDNHRSLQSFQCGESYAPPIVDTVAAGLFALGANAAAQNKEANVASAVDPQQRRHDINVTIGLLAAFAAIDVGSAIYGYHAVGDCREAQGIRLADVASARALPPPYGVPPYGEPPPLWPPRAGPVPRAAPAPAPAPFDTPAAAPPPAAPEMPPGPATPSP
jgi:hypothetical protein